MMETTNTKSMLSSFRNSPFCVFSPLIQCASAGLTHFGKAEASVEEVQAYLEGAYCGHLSVETTQLSSLEERQWVADRFEELKKKSFSPEERRQLAKVMLESQVGPRRRKTKVVYYLIHPFLYFSLATCRNLTTFWPPSFLP